MSHKLTAQEWHDKYFEALTRERLLTEALKGAQSALRKALPFLPADDEAVYCGEWLDEINAVIAKEENS